MLLIFSVILSCNAQGPKLKFPAFDKNNCSVIIPVNEKFKEFIKEKDGFLQIDESEFKDSIYMSYLSQSNIDEFIITVEALNSIKTPTPLDFSKSIIKHFQQSKNNKVDSITYKNINVDEIGEVNKVSYRFISNGIYSVYYSFFLNDKAITIGYMYIDDKPRVDTDEDIMKLNFVCP